MPYDSIAAAKKAGFPTSAEGIALTLGQINKLAELYDAIKKAGTAKNPFSVAWTAWKRLYRKTADRWVEIKTASIQFGTEPFTAASGKVEGVPEHAAMIEGRLIHLDTKNLKGWGVTTAAAKQIIDGIRGIPIRACNGNDPHACDYADDNASKIGYATRAWVDGEWVMAAAAITDPDAAKKIDDGTWTPFGKGSWSATGFPSNPTANFETDGLLNGFNPASIALVLTGSAKPAFEGSGFEMVAAAITNHRDDNMADNNEGGGNPTTYTQEQLDAKVKEALDAKIAELESIGIKHTTEELAKQKLEYDASLAKMTTEERASYDAKLVEMTPTADVNKMIAAAVAQGQADTLDMIERQRLATEYKGMLTASVVLGAPYMKDGILDAALVDTRIAEVQEMKVAAISGLIEREKMVAAAASPAQSAFDAAQVPGQAPGTATQAEKDMAVCDRMIGVV